MEFSFTTLGTASARPTSNRYPSAHILTIGGRLFLIDCGESAQIQMTRAGLSIARIDNIFISHLHGDHIFGLFGLLSTMDMIGRVSPLHMYAPAEMQSILDFFLHQFGGLKYQVVLHAVKCKEPVKILEFKSLDVYAFPLKHRVETYGYLFKEKAPQQNIIKEKIEEKHLTIEEMARLKEGNNITRDGGEVLLSSELTYTPFYPRSFAYCCDTAPLRELPGWVKGVDLMYHEATYGNDLDVLAKSTFHSTAADAAQCAKDACAGKLVIGHYSSRYRSVEVLLAEARKVFPETYLSKEGTKFDIPVKTAVSDTKNLANH